MNRIFFVVKLKKKRENQNVLKNAFGAQPWKIIFAGNHKTKMLQNTILPKMTRKSFMPESFMQ